MESAGELRDRDDLTDAANILLIDPPRTSTSDAVCVDLVAGSPGLETGLVCIVLNETPTERMTAWQPHLPADAPQEAVFITATDDDDIPTVEQWRGHTCSVETIQTPAAMTDLGLKLSTYLARWDGHVDPRICLHSLTALLEVVSLQQAYRFVNVMTSQITAEDAVAHYHLDPTIHDERTLDVLSMLFDAVIEPAGEDAWIVTTQ